MSIKLKEGDMVRFKPFEVDQVGTQFGGKIALVLKVNHKSVAYDDTVSFYLTDVDVFVDNQIETVGIGYLENVENV